jgi:hypothetical protein
MSRAMMILHAIVTAFMPAHRHIASSRRYPSIEAAPVCLARDADELEQGARDQVVRSSCFLKATAERILLGHKPQHMNGHGEHQSGVG